PAGERAVLKHGWSSLVSDIRNAVTTKYNEIFMVVSQSGDILANNSGLGLYYRDTCYLDRLELRVAGEHGIPLLADASAGRECHFEMTNGDIYLDDGQLFPKERLSIHRAYLLGRNATQEFGVRNLSLTEAQLEVTVDLASHFTNMFVIRGTQV